MRNELYECIPLFEIRPSRKLWPVYGSTMIWSMLAAFSFAAVLSCSLFAGAALYINVAEHPARMECGTEFAAKVFAPSYKRASVMQASLALVATFSGLLSYLVGGSVLGVAGAILIFFVIPFTLIVILPTNKLLLLSDPNRSTAETHGLLVRWGRLHAFRTVVSLIATTVFITAFLRS